MELANAIDFARATNQSVLVTTCRDGRPQLSNVMHSFGRDGSIRISVTVERAKYRNLERKPWAVLYVTSSDFSAYVVIEGDVELTPVAMRPDDRTVEELVDHFRTLRGEHADWGAYRETMVKERRAIVRILATRAYGKL
jgi:PPOX class probable F420-dependent enzyme